MTRPIDMPAAERFAHGTRARYTAGCRCDGCRAANTQYARDAAKRAKARALEASDPSRPATPAPQIWTAPDGTKRTRLYRRACAGINGQPCPTSSHLRKDSTGDICGNCRVRKAYRGLVSAERARAHLLELGAAGIGKRAVEAACDVPESILHEIRSGRTARIRVETERRILEVDEGAIADHATVPAEKTWRLLGELLALGIPKYKLARALGSKAQRAMPALQYKRGRVLAVTEKRIEKFHREFAKALLRETEMRAQFTDAAARGKEWLDAGGYSFIRRGGAATGAAS